MSRMEYSSNTLQVLLTKESTTYRTNDYLKNSSEADPDETSSSSAAGSSGMKDETDSLDSEIMDEDGPCRHEAKKRKLKNGGLSYPANSITATGMDEAARRQLWREKLCEWAYQVVDHFHLERELVSITMNTFDRYCATVSVQKRHGSNGVEEGKELDKDDVSLTAMTCLSLAIKLYEYKRILIPGARSTMETILKLGRGSYSLQQFEAKEFEILTKLRWMIHPPTPQLFLHHLLVEFGCREQATSNREVRDLALYLIEISVLDYSFTSYKSSEIALAALLNSIDTVMTKSCSSQQSIDFSLLGQLRVHRTTRTLQCQQRLALVHAKAAGGPATDVDTHMDAADFVDNMARMASPVSVTADLQG